MLFFFNHAFWFLQVNYVPLHPQLYPAPQNHLSATIDSWLKIAGIKPFFSSSRCNTLRLFCSNKNAAQKSGSSEPASLLIKSFDDDLCSAEDVLRSPALPVHWCLSKGFYNNVGTVHGSCVNYRRGSNCLQQSVLASFSAEVWVECLTLCRCFRPAITCTMSASLFIWQSIHANFQRRRDLLSYLHLLTVKLYASQWMLSVRYTLYTML